MNSFLLIDWILPDMPTPGKWFLGAKCENDARMNPIVS